MRAASLVLLGATLASAGCYSYRATSLDELAPGAEVRTRVSAREVERFSDHVAIDGTVLEGRFMELAGDRIFLDVPVTSGVRGMRIETMYQRLDLAAAEIAEVEVRELDRGRTTLLTAAGIAVVAAIVIDRILPGGGWGRDEGGDGTNEDRVLIRIVIPAGR